MRPLLPTQTGRRIGTVALTALLLKLSCWGADEPAAGGPAVPFPTGARVTLTFGQYGLSFVRNSGQSDAATRFEVRGQGYWLSLEQSQVVLAVASPTGLAVSQPAVWGVSDPFSWLSAITQHQTAIPSHVPTFGTFNNLAPEFREIRMKLIGAKPDAGITGEDELPGKFHYFIGHDPAQWRTNVASFAKVRYHDIYPGIDLVFYGNEGQLEYDFVLAPGADPKQIQFAIEGADGVEVEVDGNLRLAAAGQELRWRKPTIYQESDGVRVLVAGGYVLRSVVTGSYDATVHEVAFHVAPYDHNLALVIDPVLVYGTFVGGADGTSHCSTITVDGSGNAYVAGSTSAASFPTTNALIPIKPGSGSVGFITKLDAKGQIVYSTYIGPAAGVSRLAVDSADYAHLVGSTSSGAFPMVNAVQPIYGGGQSDGFVMKLTPQGSALIYSSFLGGSGNDEASGVAVDAEGSTYLTGNTTSRNFPLKNAIQTQYRGGDTDGFIAKFSPAGTNLVFSTYFGGTGFDYPGVVALDAQGSAYIPVFSSSDDLPTKAAYQSTVAGNTDGYWLALSSTGALLSASYFGGTRYDVINAVAVGSDGDLYLTGVASSYDFPIANAIQPWINAADSPFGDGANTFVARYNSRSNALVFSTFLGGSVRDISYTLALDAADNIYIGGGTLSPDFPVTADAFQMSNNGGDTSLGVGWEGVVSVLSADGSALLYSSFLGGNKSEVVSALAVDRERNVFAAGGTPSAAFPIALPVLPYPGTNSAFVVKFSPIVPGPPLLQINRAANVLHLSWPVEATNYMLEATISLPAVSWSTVTNTPTVTATNRSVQLPLTGPAQFFRLHQP